MAKKRSPNGEPDTSRIAPVTAEQVLAHLAALAKPASIREIAHGMELKHEGRRFLSRVIQKLKRKKEIEEIHGGRFRLAGAKESNVKQQNTKQAKGAAPSHSSALPVAATVSEGLVPVATLEPQRGRDPNRVAGRIVAHRDGYGFLVPDHPIPRVEGDLFIGRDSLGDAMHGDRVLARIERRRFDGRAEGRVVQILEREHPTLVGLFRYGPHGNHVLPYDIRILHEVSIPPGDELTPELRAKLGVDPKREPASMRRMRLPELDGAVVDVEIVRYPKGGLAPIGRVTEILGRPGEIGVDVEIMIRKHHLPHIFPVEVLAEARNEEQEVAKSE